ncbi:MAG TPA: hypothetical protein PLG15_02785 [Candidatus Gastranaerophilaceae bacterium]|nr:hypothetical protein [Candidatus Gastranaerophilaceae bacterium]HPT41290.1 hypothetical protein [Candidatus Gastranaerophilaceae bacterium]
MEDDKCEGCRYLLEKHFQYYQTQYIESSKYTSTIITVAYASLISFLILTYNYINDFALLVILGFLIISILLFVIQLIWNMELMRKSTEIMNELWQEYWQEKIKLNDLIQGIYTKNSEAKKEFNRWNNFLFQWTLITGILSALVLLICIFTTLISPVMLNSFQHLSSVR